MTLNNKGKLGRIPLPPIPVPVSDELVREVVKNEAICKAILERMNEYEKFVVVCLGLGLPEELICLMMRIPRDVYDIVEESAFLKMFAF